MSIVSHAITVFFEFLFFKLHSSNEFNNVIDQLENETEVFLIELELIINRHFQKAPALKMHVNHIKYTWLNLKWV